MPVLGDGDRRRARRGRRAGRRRAGRGRRADVERLRVPEPEEASPRARGDADRPARARAASRRSSASAAGRSPSPGYLVEGKPSRDFARDKAADVPRAGGLARADGQARRHVRRVRRGAGGGRRGRDPALRLLGRRALAPPTTRSSSRRTRRGSSPRSTCRRSTSAPAPRTCSRRWPAAGGDVIGLDWRVPLDEGWARVGPTGPCRATSTRRCCSARGSGSRRRRRTSSRAPAAARPHLQPRPRRPARRPTRTTSAGSSSSSTSEPRRRVAVSAAVVLMAYGSPERLEDVPAYYADIRGGRPVAPELLDDLDRALPPARDRGLEPAERDHRADAGRARGRARAPRLHRHEALDAADRGRRRGRARGRGRHASSGSCSRRTTRGSRSPATASSSSRRSPAAPSSASSRAGTTSPASSTCSPTACAAPTPTSSSRRTRCRRGSSTRATRTSEQLLETAAARRASAQALERLVVLASRASRRPASRGSGPTSSTTSTTCTRAASSDVLVCPVGFVADHLEIRWDLDTEAQEQARRARPARSPGSRCRTPTRRSSPSLAGHRAAGARGTLDAHETGRRSASTARAGASASTRSRRGRSRSSSLAPRPAPRRPRSGRCGTSRSRSSRARRSAWSAATAPARRRCSAGRRDHQADLRAGRRRRPRRLAARARRRLPPRVHRPRERLPERLDLRPQAARRSASGWTRSSPSPSSSGSSTCPVRTYSSGMYMRLGFAVAAHIEADVLLLDEVFAVGDEEFQRKCFGKIFEFKQRGGTIVFVSHDAASVERLCERAVLLRHGARRVRRLDARGDRRATTRCSPRSATPRSAPPACASGGAARRGSSRRAARARRARSGMQFPAGEPLAVELRVVAARGGRAAAASRSSCATRRGSCSPPRAQDTAELGWDEAPGERTLRFEVERLPLADGRFHLRFELGDARRRPPLPLARRRGPVRRLPGRRRARPGAARGHAGRWRRRAPLPKSGRDELPDLPRLARADGDRARPPVQALHGPRGAAAGGGAGADPARSTSTRSRSAATSTGTSSSRGTPIRAWSTRCAARTGSTSRSGRCPGPGACG